MSAMIMLGGLGSVLIVLSLITSVQNLLTVVTLSTLMLWTLSETSHLVSGVHFDSFSYLGGVASLVLFMIMWTWHNQVSGEMSILWSFVLLSSLVLVVSDHLMVSYLALEMQSLSLFVIMCYPSTHISSLEAGLKYFVVSAFSSGVFLLGCLGVFMETGTLFMGEFMELLLSSNGPSLWLYGFLVCSLLLKLAAAPFHVWIPDVYQGSSPMTVMLLSSIPKMGVWFFLVKVCCGHSLLLIASASSMLMGTLGALNQTSILSLMAYSGIMNMGFVMWGAFYASPYSYSISFIYLILYLLSASVWVGLVSWFSSSRWILSDVAHVYYYNPAGAFCQTVILFSLAGIPPLAGFIGKWWVLQLGISQGQWLLSLLAMLMTVIGAFYYLSIMSISYFYASSFPPAWSLALLNPYRVSLGQSTSVAVSTVFLLLCMYNPTFLIAITSPMMTVY